MSTLSSTEASLVAGPPSLPDANAGETGQGETGAEETTRATATTAEAVPETEAETQPQPEETSAPAKAGEGEAEAEAAEAAGEGEEERAAYPEWLPWEPMKAYPDEILALAAKQFGISPELLGQKGVKELLAGNINALIEGRNNSLAVEEEQAEAAEVEEGAEAKGEEGAEEKVTFTVPELHETAMEIVEDIVTPEGATMYATGLKSAMDALYDAHQAGDKEAIAKAEQGVTKTNMAFLVMALRETLPMFLPAHIDRRIDQFATNMRETRRSHSEAVTRLGKDPRYSTVKQFVESGKLQSVFEKYPELAQKRFSKAVDGKRVALGAVENRMEQYKAAMALYRGSSNPPAPVLVTKGMEAGRRAAEAATNKRELGKLSAGRATGRQITGSQGETSQEYIARLKEAADSEDPLAHAPRAKRA